MAVLGANYLLARLRGAYDVPYDRRVMHECVLSDRGLAATGVTTLDVAKRLIDYGYHPPTVYFPLIVPGAIMIEPTESESLEGLDRFVAAMLAIAREAREDPELVRSAPHHTRRSRLDETRAARQPVLRWRPPE
jgi:glycine dehydrogenase subunit 2